MQYLTLSCIAHNYLAIQGSSVPSEHAFSSGSLTATAHCNCLKGDIFEALQILKSGYRNGHIGAAAEAEHHINAYLETLAMLDNDTVWDNAETMLDDEDTM